MSKQYDVFIRKIIKIRVAAKNETEAHEKVHNSTDPDVIISEGTIEEETEDIMEVQE